MKMFIKTAMTILAVILSAAVILFGTAVIYAAIAEGAQAPAADVGMVPIEEPMTWGYLATIAGASTLTLLIVQFFKLPLDKVWHIPTRLLTYVIAWGILLLGTHFTGGLTWDATLLAAANALLAAMAAMGAYEVTFAKLEK